MGSHWIIGTTDTDWNLDLAHPAATKADIDYILGTVNAVLATPRRTPTLRSVYAGRGRRLPGKRRHLSCPGKHAGCAGGGPGG